MKRYLGVDLHRTQFTVCTRLESGRTYLRQWPIKELKQFAAQLRKEDEIAVEATGNTRLFHDAVVEHVERVVVVNPGQFKVISQSVKKTDRNATEAREKRRHPGTSSTTKLRSIETVCCHQA